MPTMATPRPMMSQSPSEMPQMVADTGQGAQPQSRPRAVHTFFGGAYVKAFVN
jgi:hypothetical protein